MRRVNLYEYREGLDFGVEVGSVLAALAAEFAIVVWSLFQSKGIVFFRKYTAADVDGVSHYHTEIMTIARLLLIGFLLIAAVTAALALIDWLLQLHLTKLLLPVGVLVFCGVLSQAYLNPTGLFKHLLTIAAGFVCGILMMFLIHFPMTERLFRRMCFVLIVLSGAFLIWGLIFQTNGSGAWVGPLQPGEIWKLLILLLSVTGFDVICRDASCRRLYLLTAAAMLLYVVLIRDLGNAVIIAALIAVMLIAVGQWKVVCSAAALGAAGGGLFLLLAKHGLFSSVYSKIISRFSQAGLYPLTHWENSSANQNLRAGLLALIRGGLIGSGVSGSNALYAQNVYASQTDFTFVCSISVFGILYGVTVLLAIGVLLWNITPSLKETGGANFRLYQGAVIGCLFLAQAAVHILGSLTLIPMTGVTLPFISAGGSSMAVSFMAAGALAGLYLPKRHRAAIRDSGIFRLLSEFVNQDIPWPDIKLPAIHSDAECGRRN